MRSQLRMVVAFLAMALAVGAWPSEAAASRGVVYLLRGGLNVFSTGMDEVAVKLRARGVNAKTAGHADWQAVANELANTWTRKHEPIVLAGHSWGANADILVANALNDRGIPVALIVLFDPTTALLVPGNVKRVINYYSTTANGQNLQVGRGYGFSGSLVNMLQPVGHLEIDNWVPLQEKAIREIMRVTGGK